MNPPTGNAPRRLSVRHVTRYSYDKPVTRSSHRLRLRPITDRKQTVLDHVLDVSVPVQTIEYDDVFGNNVIRFDVTEPYTELTITAKSTVELLDTDPFGFAKAPIHPSFPLVWMPWERVMLNPYLVPVELPDTQLQAITEYAMSFVERNHNDLMETLFAINLSFKRDFKYLPGSTTIATTPYDVLVTKHGVCQDFANLFICMARLLGIPARYVCGYLFTGNHGEQRLGCDASHAWVSLYIPNIGWKSFDPTNAILPNVDHVRVAYGRHFSDTAPTAGALYSPATESLHVDVEVTEAPELEPPVQQEKTVEETHHF